MQIVIDIDKEQYEMVKQYRGSYDFGYAIAEGTVLPENYGRLIDADAFERRCMFDKNIEDMQDVIYALRDYPAIIEGTESKE